MPLLQYRFRNLLAYVAALFVASASYLSRARDTVARTRDTSSPYCRIESTIVNFFILKAYFALFFDFLFFFRFLAIFCKSQIRLCKISRAKFLCYREQYKVYAYQKQECPSTRARP